MDRSIAVADEVALRIDRVAGAERSELRRVAGQCNHDRLDTL